MKKYVQYMSYILRHKWFVLVECWKRGLYWRGLVHDLSKFYPSEFFPYVNHFYNKTLPQNSPGYIKLGHSGDEAFELAWLRHQNRNDHHWQWWLLVEDEGRNLSKEMTDSARLEMVCDWIGASKAQGRGGNIKPWWDANRRNIILHPSTEKWVDETVSKL